MPLEGDAQAIGEYPLARKGINLKVRKQGLEADTKTSCTPGVTGKTVRHRLGR